MADYTPTQFVNPKTGASATAYTWQEHYQLLWDGYAPVGNVPQLPRGSVPAMLADIDAAVQAGPGVIARGRNVTAVASVVAGTAGALFGCVIVVPPTERPVTLKWAGTATLTVLPAGGNGFCMLQAYDVTSGAVLLEASSIKVRSTDDVNGTVGSWFGEVPVGKSSTWRRFGLYGQTNKSAAATAVPTMNVTNWSSFSSTWIAAEVK